DGWVEDTWAALEVGAVHSEVLMATPRCTMPSRAQPGFEVDKLIGTTIRDRHDNNLGVYASITRGGAVSLGDTVYAS
ncbi:MAG: sulfurase, partial [Acidimicrobiales bacterium]